ncbi:uncharacterized protein DC041_0002117, partial [Schistosoma bovis]
CGYKESLKEDVFLGLIPVRLRAGDKEVSGYAFLDNGSDTTLIKLSTVRRLGLSSGSASTTIKAVNGNKLSRSTTKVIKAYSLNRDECICIEQAVVVEDLPVHRPRVPVKDSAKKWPHLIDLPWTESVDGEVMLLIGCDVPEAHWVLDQRLGGRKSPYAIRTLLGWVLFGPAGFSKNSKRIVNYISQSDNPVEQLKEIYNYEFADVHSSDKALSLNDKTAQKFSSDCDSSVGESVLNNFYVDDCLVSFPNDEDAKSFVVQLNELMTRGGFKLKKWVTNSEIVRKVFPQSDSMEAIVDMPLNQGPTHRALGIEWDTTHDVFNFRFDPGKKLRLEEEYYSPFHLFSVLWA